MVLKVNTYFRWLNCSDSSSTNDIPGVVDGVEEEAESLLKLPKVPFAMDLDVHSNRSSVISQVSQIYNSCFPLVMQTFPY